ncbi:MAG TPA: cyclopropane-fatty-acyl-phospholipid synthase family protein [Candidatus Andersenbacteria bacterium]|nr:cyclopropane-fatty-acyl-phospholipid synthase family protein [Candidatus Andersenbacteria bacterium]
MILDAFIIKRLQQNWNGPAFLLISNKKEVKIGQGQPELKVILQGGYTLDKIAMSPSLGFGEAYMNGEAVVEGDIMALFQGFQQSPYIVPEFIRTIKRWLRYIPISIGGAVNNAQHHYDIGNDFYGLWLDSTRTYTCAYFLSDEDSLDDAQYQKNDLVCKKIRLEPGMKMLDIGCGWGGALFHAALYYGADVTGITPAKEQAAFIIDKAKKLGIADRVHVIIADWRELEKLDANTKFDRIISIGMFEHVGRAQYARFFTLWKKLLSDTGISLLHTIGATNDENSGQDPWIQKYIFPGGYIPLLREVIRGACRAQLHVVDCENLWQHYAKTLHHWHANVENHKTEVVDMFDQRFYRMWTLYLQSCEAGFKWGDLQLYQTVLLGKDAIWPLNREVHAELTKREKQA